ncbi:hypothetical protein VFPPC_14912 [Pochonia chlamydosporia 170]|uniref:Uncharacterized protein n=1 Tax=Pochonia chlamydosporia 170 TaxID=1380566 RepID=A0A179EXI0_METCM|nr:hypothetical protein VFPPC_14912 [Pochonia chlamydosporia 170]OAQ57895.1 hypothetical protein VFPPC_14912 [Pochonia chlamydosporia 170]
MNHSSQDETRNLTDEFGGGNLETPASTIIHPNIMNYHVEVDAATSSSIPAVAGVSPVPVSTSPEFVTPPLQGYVDRAPGPSPQSDDRLGDDNEPASNHSSSLQEVINELRYQPDRSHRGNFMLQLRHRVKSLLATMQSPLTVDESDFAKLYLTNPLRVNIIHYNNMVTNDYNEQVFAEIVSFIHQLSATFLDVAQDLANFYSGGLFGQTDDSMMDTLLFLRLVVPRLHQLRAVFTEPTQLDIVDLPE